MYVTDNETTFVRLMGAKMAQWVEHQCGLGLYPELGIRSTLKIFLLVLAFL